MASKKNSLRDAVELDKFFSNAPENTPEKNEGSKEEVKKKSPEKSLKAVKKVFSFRAEAETVDSWRLWADAKGMKVDDLGEKALQEYIRKHPLTEDQKQIFELKKKQKS